MVFFKIRGLMRCGLGWCLLSIMVGTCNAAYPGSNQFMSGGRTSCEYRFAGIQSLHLSRTISTWYEIIAGGIEKIWDDIAAGIMKNRLWKRLP